MKKILLVAYAFPPIPYGGSYRSLRLCRGLVARGVSCHVVTVRELDDVPNDYHLAAQIPSQVAVTRTSIIDPWRRYQAVKRRYLGKRWFKYVNKVISLLLRGITFPDHMLLWVPFAYLHSRRICKAHDIDTVLVSSPPDSAHLVGWMLQRSLKVRWVADFRDPIHGNVARVSMIEPKALLDKMEKWLLKRYDRFVALRADILLANTETHARQLKMEYGLEHVHVVRNSYDPADYEGLLNLPRFPLYTIAHVGSVYGRRNPEVLFKALSRIVEEASPERPALELIFLGLGGNTLAEQIEQFGLSDYVKVREQVPHDQALEVMCRSHLLLLIKATGKWSLGQIPGKFFEYIGSRNRILCIGPKGSEVASLIREHDLGEVVEDDMEEMLAILKRNYHQFAEDGGCQRLAVQQVSPFSSVKMVESVYRILYKE
jgi:glycosyltransferase involved in cell wall biosynthesis